MKRLMRKSLQCLLLVAALYAPTQMMGQVPLSMYNFTTGVDNTKWMTLTSPTQMLGPNNDDAASSLYNIGFSFTFGESEYTKFSANSNGNVRLGNTVISSGAYTTPFGSSYYTNNLPKIIGFGRDCGTGSGGYVKYQLFGSAPNRTLVVEFKCSYSTSGTADVNWQVQLHETTNEVTIVCASTTPSSISSYQAGLAAAANDIAIINPSSHTVSYYSTYNSSTYSTWHGANRYYSFIPPVVTCPRPTALTATNITTTDADISWTPVGTEMEWELTIDTDVYYVTNSTYNAMGLQSGTDYRVRVRAICDIGDTSRYLDYAFTTVCEPISQLPYTENFDNRGTGSSSDRLHPVCWQYITNTTSAYGYLTSGGYVNNCLHLYSYSTYIGISLLPEVDASIPVNTLTVTFRAKMSTSYTNSLIVGVTDAPNNLAAFTPVDTIALTTSWDEYEIPLTNYSGTGNYIGFRTLRTTSSYCYAYIDNLSLDVTSDCLRPNHLSVDSATGTSIFLSWNERNGANLWTIAYDTAPITDFSYATTTTATTNPTQINGLLPNHVYYFYVSTSCSMSNSSWSEPVTGRTDMDCDTLTMLREVTGPRTGSNSYVPIYSSYGNTFSETIYTADQLTDAGLFPGYIHKIGYKWLSSTYSKNVRIYMGFTSQSDFSTSYTSLIPITQMTEVYSNTSFQPQTNVDEYYTLDRPLYWDGMSNIVIAFLANQDASSGQTSSGSSGYTCASSTRTASTSSRYVSFYRYRDSYPYDPATCLDASPGGYSSSYSYTTYSPDVEFVMCSNVPACLTPRHMVPVTTTATTATLSWEERGTAAAWNVVVSTMPITDFSHVNPTYPSVIDTFINLTSLNPVTTYYAYVQADCGSDGFSGWTGCVFRTGCGEISLFPYTENFDSYDGYTSTSCSSTYHCLPDCWDYINTGTQSSYMGYPFMYNYSSQAYSGTNSVRFYISSSATYGEQSAITPEFQDVNNLQITFMAKTESSSYTTTSRLAVGVIEDTNITWMDTIADLTNIYKEYEIPLSSYRGGGNRIIIRALHPTSGTCIAYIDDVMVAPIPTCFRPTDYTMIAATDSSVTLTWNDPNNANQWTIDYSTYFPFVPGTATRVIANSNPFTITGLQPNTVYYSYMHADCDAYDTSYNVALTFRTECGPQRTLPYTHGFEDASGTGTAATINHCWKKYTNNTTPYPYPSNSSHSGNYSMYFYADATYYSYLVLPRFADSIQNLKLSLWSRSSSTSYNGNLRIGVMSDPTDISTFDLVDVAIPDGVNWTEHTVGFHDYNGFGEYIAILCANTGTNYTYLDDVTVDRVSSCPAPSNITVTNAVGYSAMVSWNHTSGQTSVPPTGYSISYRNLLGGTTSTINNVTSPYMLTGLMPGNSYRLYLTAICDSSTGQTDSITFNTDCIEGGIHTVGTGTSSSYYIPVYNSNLYSYSQQLFLTSEMRGAGPIRGIELNFMGSSAMLCKSNCTIYMGHTSQTSLASNTMLPVSSMQVVYRGPLNCVPGWNTFYFDTPFNYNGSSNLVLAIFDNSGNSCGSTYKFQTSTASGKTLYTYSSSTLNPSSISSMTTYSYRTNIKFLIKCDTSRVCVPPSITVTNTTATQIDLAWAPGRRDTSWTVEYKESSTSTWTTLFASTTARTGSITGLTANTSYDIRVGALCNGSYTYDTITTTTLCSLAAIPFTEDFETWTSTSTYVPPCWHKKSGYSTSYPATTTSYRHNGSRSLMLQYSGTNTYSYVALPVMDAPLDTLLINFYAYKNNSSYPHNIWVGVMSDPDDANTFSLVQQVNPVNTSRWEECEVLFENYTGTGKYIALMSPAGEYSYPYIDDITVNYLPGCRRPTYVTVRNVSLNSATIMWRGNAGDYDLEYGPSGFTHGTGTTVRVSGASSYTLTGLTPSTTYDVYVQGICSPTDFSGWSFVKTFTTDCGMIDSLPFSEPFDNYGYGSPNYPIPNCWTKSCTQTNYPYIQSGGYSGNYLYMYCGSNGYCLAAMPALDTSLFNIRNMKVTFKARLQSSSYNNPIIVGVMTNPNIRGTFVPVDTVQLQSTTWEEYMVPFVDYTGSGNYVAFYISGTTYTYGLIDNLVLDSITECLEPTRLSSSNPTSSSVDLSWHDRASASRWVIEYGEPGFTRGTGTMVIATTNPFTLTGLPSSYSGEFYVRAICDDGDTSGYNRIKGSFATRQIPATLPYYCSFEEDEQESSSWTILNNGAPNCWTLGSAIADIGTRSMYVSKDNGTTNSYTVSANSVVWIYRDIIFPSANPTDTFKLQLSWRAYGESGNDYIKVYVSRLLADVTGGSIAGISAPERSVDLTSRYAANSLMNMQSNFITSTFKFTSNDIGGSGTKRLYIAWRNNNSGGTQPPAAIDEIILSRPDYVCATPANLNVSNIRYNTATVTWLATGTEYEIVFRPSTSTTWSTLTPVHGNSYTFSNLTANTTYSFKLRQNCDTMGYSEWATGTFTTPQMPCFPPINLIATNPTTSSVSLNWEPGGNETRWRVHVFNGIFDTSVVVTSHPYTVGGLMANTTYKANIIALCGNNGNESVGGDTITFTTTGCAPVSLVNVTSITSSSATVSWTPGSNGSSWQLQYGPYGVGQGEGTAVRASTSSYTITGLQPATSYDVYVRTACGSRLVSTWSGRVSFTTTGGSGSRYSINATSNDESMGTVIGGGTFPRGSVTTLTANPITGYVLGHWQDGNTDNPRVITVTRDANYTAYFTMATYYVTAIPSNSMMGSVGGSGYYTYNSTATLTATPATGYHFVRWHDGNTNAQRTVNVLEDVTYTAFFAAETYTVNVTVDDVTKGCAVGGGQYSYRDSVILEATPNEGFVFSHWNDNNTDNPRRVVALTDVTYTASFDVQAPSTYNINVVASEPSKGTVDGGGHYLAGSPVTLIAHPFNGCHFVGWRETNSNANPYTFTATSDTTLTALFAADTFTITALADPATLGRVTGGGSYPEGTRIVLTAVPVDSAMFTHWLEDNSTNNPRTVTVDANATYTAVFERRVGIRDVISSQQQVAIHPNPTSGMTTISISGMQGTVLLTIIDINGREVMRNQLECQGDCVKSINVQGLSAGAYFVRVSGENGSNTVKKLIVK